ncbi:hypothetical protein PV11_07635 [Exophiala sideris]|uniref:Zn(2)-C6 fungal-type domain-containing protein n=1 Tax=Exophiala sideris TaxID=1016849 RepID=A0A0D1YZC8_9EURO|nr:hypothetical protein PV11_07635 [Exophiala sideris]
MSSSYSKGCFSCRRMKIKCDQRTPGCARCERGKRTCPGYPDPWNLKFRDMNPVVVAKSQQSANLAIDAAEARSSPYLILRQPSSDWHAQALCFFFDRYILPPWDGGYGFLDFVPEMRKSRNTCGYFLKAVDAASLASFGNLSSIQSISFMADSAYGQALNLLSKALQQQQHDIENQCEVLLATLVMLQLYELIAGSDRRKQNPHIAGIEALLKIARPRLETNSTGRRVLHAIDMQRIISGPRGDPREEPAASPGPPSPNKPPSRAASCKSQLVMLLAQAAKAVRELHRCVSSVNASSHAEGPSMVDKAITAAVAVEQSLELWTGSLPPALQIRCISQPQVVDCQSASVYPKWLYAFHNLQHAGMWTAFWCTRCTLLQEIIVALRACPPSTSAISPSRQMDRLQGELRTVVNDICNSTSYMFGEIDNSGNLQGSGTNKVLGSYFMLQLLNRALTVPNIPSTQRAWMLAQLERIGRVGGIRYALTLRNSFLTIDDEVGTCI